MAELTRVTRNHVEMVDSVDRGRDGWTLDKGKMDLTKRIMMRVIGLSGGRVIIDVCTLGKQVAKEDTRGGKRSKFVHRVRSKPWMT